MVRINKQNFKTWFASLSPNVKFTSARAILGRYMSEINGGVEITLTRKNYGTKDKRYILPAWAADFAGSKTAPFYPNAAEIRDMTRAKKAFFKPLVNRI